MKRLLLALPTVAMRYLTLLLLAVSLVGCQDVTGPGGVSLNGKWTYSLTASNAVGAMCESAGDVSFDQRGAEFTGKATGPVDCAWGAGRCVANDCRVFHKCCTSSVLAGDITTTQTRFDLQLSNELFTHIVCHVTVSSAAIHDGHMAGVVACEVQLLFDSPEQLNGTWEATR